jgi:ankyrin repeat protein
MMTQGLDKSQVSKDGSTPYMLADLEGHQAVATELATLRFAVASGNLQQIRRLLEQGATLAERYERGRTVMHDVASRSNVRIMMSLVREFGADIEVADSLGDRPLHVACRSGRENMVRALLEIGADPRAPNLNNETPLHHAAAAGHLVVIRILLTRPSVRINASDAKGFTPLHCAAVHCHKELIETLLAAGADPTHESSDKMIPHDIAKKHGLMEIADMLLPPETAMLEPEPQPVGDELQQQLNSSASAAARATPTLSRSGSSSKLAHRAPVSGAKHMSKTEREAKEHVLILATLIFSI